MAGGRLSNDEGAGVGESGEGEGAPGINSCGGQGEGDCSSGTGETGPGDGGISVSVDKVAVGEVANGEETGEGETVTANETVEVTSGEGDGEATGIRMEHESPFNARISANRKYTMNRLETLFSGFG